MQAADDSSFYTITTKGEVQVWNTKDVLEKIEEAEAKDGEVIPIVEDLDPVQEIETNRRILCLNVRKLEDVEVKLGEKRKP